MSTFSVSDFEGLVLREFLEFCHAQACKLHVLGEISPFSRDKAGFGEFVFSQNRLVARQDFGIFISGQFWTLSKKI